ncbi:hypothetical protein E8E15_002325 [Penicillium rubens]|nr:hypothetical protein E8E15_002325 [Penicillium rubens]
MYHVSEAWFQGLHAFGSSWRDIGGKRVGIASQLMTRPAINYGPGEVWRLIDELKDIIHRQTAFFKAELQEVEHEQNQAV